MASLELDIAASLITESLARIEFVYGGSELQKSFPREALVIHEDPTVRLPGAASLRPTDPANRDRPLPPPEPTTG